MSNSMTSSGDVVDRIAEMLGETADVPRKQIARIVTTIGIRRTWAFVNEALEIEANGGMMLPDGSRRRTLGGVFFHLVRNGISAEERDVIFPPWTPKKKRKQKPEGSTHVQEVLPSAEAEPQSPKISQFWLDLAAGKPLSYKWTSKERA